MIVCVRTNLSILADFVLLLTTMTNTMKLAEVHFFDHEQVSMFSDGSL